MISEEAIALILEFEGIDQPGSWPGAQSGITIGVGYDLGYTPRTEFVRDWRVYLTAGQITRLGRAIGVKGRAARAMAGEYRDIRITQAIARAVFTQATLPKWERMTRSAFPGSQEILPADAFGALVSLTFNRGTDMVGDRRREMRSIRTRLQVFAGAADASARDLGQLLAGIAADVRAMKRIWVGQGLNGLLRRRDAEANLIETAA